MKYENITDGILRFRANDENGLKREYALKPGESMESDREVKFGGLKPLKEKVGKGKSKIIETESE